jgi:ABC-type iron transport system FetAB ATPase subunit
VYYDGRLTSSVNLDALRTSITIIPQMPELLSGTLRQNLDPFDQHDDATLNSGLRSAGLYSLQEQREGEDEGTKINLDSDISSGGGNLSVGQRQIIALARAIVRGSKLLILDEATSAIGASPFSDVISFILMLYVDYNTDSVIQESLRKELGKDVTVITIAHRLRTIMDADKIVCAVLCYCLRWAEYLPFDQLVLDAGRVVSFSSSKVLEHRSDFYFALRLNSIAPGYCSKTQMAFSAAWWITLATGTLYTLWLGHRSNDSRDFGLLVHLF